jgi:hypothetical protein
MVEPAGSVAGLEVAYRVDQPSIMLEEPAFTVVLVVELAAQ